MTWLMANLPTVRELLLAHLAQAVPTVVAAFLLTLPLACLARRVRKVRAVLVTSSSLLYAVPSLALFVVLPMVLGTSIRSPVNVVVATTLYGMSQLAPAAVSALEAVDTGVLDAATAMGMGRARRFVTVELPLAGPAILAGLRVVTVSTISLTTIGAVLGVRSLGHLFTDGFQRGIISEIVTGVVATVLLAVLLDVLVVAAGWLALPWARHHRRRLAGAQAGGQA